ncbi:MAG TPA: nucleotide exchange factor GrpE [Candidatus Binatia bacterium]|nr:nucleotide exchange factor GrpE [Candidatus Binatia bacterium]
MGEDTSRKKLDLEHEVPSMQESDSPQAPIRTHGETERQSHSVGENPQNDGSDPAKLRERLARVQADFDNARKRSLKEQKEFQEYAVFDTANELLPVVDSLEQALQVSPSNGEDLHTGVELIQKQLLDVLFTIGVRPIHALGEHFDPRIHHAVATVDTDVVEDQTVVGELQCGYKFKNRLLRPAKVTVATRIPPELGY